MDTGNPGWEFAAIFGRIDLYYFTGTIQDGVLLITRDRDPVFWVRRSYDRAVEESLFPDIRKMDSFREAAQATPGLYQDLYIETETVPVALVERFRKHFPVKTIRPLDLQVAKVRSVKSSYEISLLEKAGHIHREVLEDCVPGMLGEGLSEAELGAEIYTLMVREGHQGIVRFGGFNVEIELGQVGFGENSLYPTRLDSPGGSRGISPAAPVLGNLGRKLSEGDMVFVDIGCGVDGYHTDKTMTYQFGGPVPEYAAIAHWKCVEIQDEMASMLKPGTAPSEIYENILRGLSPDFLKDFMGFGNRRVNFLGHGVGLQIDEMPVIAKGFDDPLEEGMVIALEPKKGIGGVGMVGTENTFEVTPSGGRSITGASPGLIPVW